MQIQHIGSPVSFFWNPIRNTEYVLTSNAMLLSSLNLPSDNNLDLNFKLMHKQFTHPVPAATTFQFPVRGSQFRVTILIHVKYLILRMVTSITNLRAKPTGKRGEINLMYIHKKIAFSIMSWMAALPLLGIYFFIGEQYVVSDKKKNYFCCQFMKIFLHWS